MAARKKRLNDSAVGAFSPRLLWAARLAIGLALAVSGYLAYVTLTQGTVVGCAGDSGCGTVLQSRWSKWFGLPVSLFAVIIDAAILGATLRLGPKVSPMAQRRAWRWLVPLTMMVAVAAVWFIALQLLVVRAICPYCMVAHVSGLGAAILLLSGAMRANAAGEKERSDLLPRAEFKKAWVLAGLAFATLAFGQVAQAPPKTFSVTPMAKLTNNFKAPALSTNVPMASKVSAVSNGAVSSVLPGVSPWPGRTTRGSRLFPVYQGRFQVDLGQVPVLGAWTNQHVIVSLLDYTCHHCRAMHPLLVELQRTFSDRLVIACLPMPLDPGCNWTVTRHYAAHTNACEYARLGLSVWRADPSKYPSYEDWVMEGEEHPPPLDLARQKALDLVGAAALQKAAQDPWVDQQLRQDVSIYEVAYRERQGQMPQLMIGPNVAVGTYPRAELYKVVESVFGLREGP